MTYELHPLCTLFPRLSGAEFGALRDDIKANGLRQPIVLHGGMILDGGNRYRACVEAGVKPTFTEFAGGNLVSFVLSANLHRRHMSAGQQAAIVASAQDWAQAQPASRPEKAGNVAGLSTVAQRAAQSGAGERTQRMADKVAKADPALAVQVAHGEVSLPKAHAQVSTPRPAAPAPAPEPAPAPAPAPKLAPAPAADPLPDGPSLEELIDELQAENTALQAVVKAAEANDLKAEAMKWRRAYDGAVRAQSDAMNRAAQYQKELDWYSRQLKRIGKALGEADPAKVAPRAEALARSHKEAA